MPAAGDQQTQFDEIWYEYLTGELPEGANTEESSGLNLGQRVLRMLPGAPRCLGCDAPLSGLGNLAVRAFGFGPASYSPRMCNMCEKMVREHEGGAEVDLSLLFADIRGSTRMAEILGTVKFQQLIRRFYEVASETIIENNGMVNRLMGDQVIGLFVPRFAGPGHAGVAIETGKRLLVATGHEAEDGPWVPVGAGVHSGRAYVGAVGTSQGVNEIAVLGNTANLAARLSSEAGAGELLISEDVPVSGEQSDALLDRSEIVLKGIEEPVGVHVMQVGPDRRGAAA